jgi:hypothetical protein
MSQGAGRDLKWDVANTKHECSPLGRDAGYTFIWKSNLGKEEKQLSEIQAEEIKILKNKVMYDITKYRNENILKDSYIFLFQIISFFTNFHCG